VANRPDKPDVIFISAAALRWDALGCFGKAQGPTPKLDLLAERSTVFERHFTTCPLGVPARSSWLTGLPPHRHGASISGWLAAERDHGQVTPGLPLLTDRLADTGYHVLHAGVQQARVTPALHERGNVEVLGPTHVGQHYHEITERGLLIGDTSYFKDPCFEFHDGQPFLSPATNARTGVFPLREDLWYDRVIAERAINRIDQLAAENSEQPLALLCNFWLPHAPLWAPQEHAQMIHPDEIKLPRTVGRWYPGMPINHLLNVCGQLGAHLDEAAWREAWAVYAGMVALLDQCVGRVLGALDRAGRLDDALVVFTSDHGEMLGSHRLYAKLCMYEDVMHVPLLVKLPGQQSSRRVKGLTHHLDVVKTLLDAAEAAPLHDHDGPAALGGDDDAAFGESLLPLAGGAGSAVPGRSHVYASYDGNAGRGFAQRMARSTSHKLVDHYQDGGVQHSELYDLVDDPRETRNLAGKPEAAELEHELREKLTDWMRHCDDPLVA